MRTIADPTWWFKVKRRLRKAQGSALSPALFNLIMEFIKRKVKYEEKNKETKIRDLWSKKSEAVHEALDDKNQHLKVGRA